MATPCSKRQQQKTGPLVSEAREEPPPPLIRRILASWWGRAVVVLTGLGGLATLWALADAYSEFHPTIQPLSFSSAPTEFRIENKNPIFNMKNVELTCYVENATFDTDHGPIEFSIPVVSGTVNTSIQSKSSAHYPCDATPFISFPNGHICLVGLCNNQLVIPLTWRVFHV